MVHNVALVLGGGGAAGQAWQIGVIAGLAEAGLDLTEAADLVIGTSSGSTTAAWVRSGIPAAELLASVLSEPVRPVGQNVGHNRERPPSLPMATVFERMRAIGAAATSAADLRRAMGAFGLESDSILGPAAAGQRRAMVAARLPRPEWPDRPMIVVAVEAHTGELAAFDRDSGVDLVDAVTASTALPGGPTHSINGTRYINGGVRSGENADLASGFANVVVLSPFGGWSQRPLPAGQFEGLRRDPEWGTDLASEVEALRKQGSRVEVITPDADSLAAMGTNQMDPATRIPAARAGYAQGKQEATRVTVL
jgi:NTE family protein